MKAGIEVWKFYISVTVIVILFPNTITGGFLSPPLEAIPENVDKVTIIGNQMNINEGLPKQGDAQFRVAKIRHDGDANNITLNGQPPGMVVVPEGSDAYLALTSALDYETLPLTYSFLMSQGGSIQPLIVAKVDINDNAPQFKEPCTNEEIWEDKYEDTPILVCKFEAIDPDKIDMDEGVLRYHLEESIPGGKENYNLNDVSGEFTLIKALDYMASPIHRFSISVTDSPLGDPIHRTNTIFTINIKDVPNLPPVWSIFKPLVTVEEGPRSSEPITQIQAKDGDIQVKCDMKYTIQFAAEHDAFMKQFFFLDEDTGNLNVIKDIDATEIYARIGGLVIDAQVMVMESNKRPEWDAIKYPNLNLTDSIQITIRDINDNKPEFCATEDDCSPFDIVIEVDEHTIGTLPLNINTGSVNAKSEAFVIRDMDPDPRFSTFNVVLVAEPGQQYVSDALIINPNRGISTGEFSISARNSASLDYEEKLPPGSENEDTEGKWWKIGEDGKRQPKEISFKIRATESSDPLIFKEQNVKLIVKDINDNEPQHVYPWVSEDTEQIYTIAICENVANGVLLKNMTNYDPSYPVCPVGNGDDVRIKATDADISEKYGTESIEYLWSSAKIPPLELDENDGTMIVKYPTGSLEAFNYERFTEEIFTVIAIDEKENKSSTTRKRSNAVLKLVILDVNDTPVDLKLNTSRVKVQENKTDATFAVNISADDVDLTACIQFDQEVQVEGTTGNAELDANITKWFKIETVSGNCSQSSEARIAIGLLPIDREGCADPEVCPEVDRVDVIITARDTETVTSANHSTMRLTIEIEDINDNEPTFQDVPNEIRYSENTCDESGDSSTTLAPDETTALPVCGNDTESPYKREIASFRVTDRDRNSTFTFSLRSIYEEMVDLVELDPLEGEETTNGRVILRRKSGMIIDREYQGFYGRDTDTLEYILTVNDREHSKSIDVKIDIEDINDNTPVFVTTIQEYTVIETIGGTVATFEATDKDKKNDKGYGDVSYKFKPANDNDYGQDEFTMELNTGKLSVIADKTHWESKKHYQLIIQAIDYYRESSSSQSNTAEMPVNITVIDINNSPPVFETPGVKLNTQKETWMEARFPVPFKVTDADDYTLGNGDFDVAITNVQCSDCRPGSDPPDTFFKKELIIQPNTTNPSEKWFYIVPAKSFENNYGNYTLTFKATDKPKRDQPSYREPLDETATYIIEIQSENLHHPEFKFPQVNETKLYIPVRQQVNVDLEDFYGNTVDLIEATDQDDPNHENGQVIINLDASGDEVTSIFKLVPNGKRYNLQIHEPFPANNTLYTIILTASDKGDPPLSTVMILKIQVVPAGNSPPLFRLEDGPRPFNVTITENEIASEDITIAYDLDLEINIEENHTIYYFIANERAKNYFKLETDRIDDGEIVKFQTRLVTIAPLDREEVDLHQFFIYVSNIETPTLTESPDPEDLSYLPVNVIVKDVKDVPPSFVANGIISAGISERVHSQTNFVTTILAIDLDLDDQLTFEIVPPIDVSDSSLQSTPNPPVELSSVGNLTLKFRPTASMKGYFSFTVKVTDSVFMSSTIDCRIYIITEDNVVNFVFSNTFDELDKKRDYLIRVLSDVFKYQCNIDNMVEDARSRQNGDENDRVTTVTSHFIDLKKNVPISKEEIRNAQFSSATIKELGEQLRREGILYDRLDNETENKASEENLVTYFLIAGIAILGSVLVVSSVMWFFNNRGLTRQLRAHRATAFGSQDSGLNRAGATTMELPNTNQHAIEGSNPVWTTQGERKMPQFDTESVGSGGSILIGVEDEDDFKNYNNTETGRMGMSNPLFNMEMDDGDNGFGNPMYSENDDNSIDDSSPHNPEFPYINQDDDHLDVPMPAVSRRNPLMNMDMHMDDSDG